ncbi:glucose 1-dehydrogenase [Mycobacterium sp. SA01]|uniref:glucose 1-dehydrogenase n=1 Tax=Mycobacterium sp. SA01 TaxID=3238820 RepID=UPI00351BC466
MGRVDGKVAVITGAARGMGAAHARLLVSEGAKVVLGDVLDDEGAAVAAALGHDARYIHLDVSDPDDWAAAVALALRGFGTLNVLVNNAGIVYRRTLKNLERERWQRVIDVNLTGTMLGMKSVIEPMTAAGGGSIINMSSIQAMRGTPGNHGYVASKWAIRGLTKSAALELAANNIRVNSLHPGMIRTPMTAHMPDDLVAAPMGRLGEPDEVSSFVLFLASDESSYATGSEFVMDGGLITDVPHRMFD